MRLVSFNLLHGRATSDGRVEAARLRNAIAGLGAHVIAIQEVDRDQPRSHKLDLTAIVASAAGARTGDWRFEPTLFGTPGKRWRPATDVGGGHRSVGPAYGVGLVSTYPVRSWHTLRLTRAPVRSPVAVPSANGPRLRLLEDEPRVGLAAVVDGPSGPLTVACTHLSFVPGWNILQLRKLVRWLSRLPSPAVLLGDLNLPGGLPRIASGWVPLARLATYPAAEPLIQLDHALGFGPLPRVTHAAAEPLPVSDHRALVVDLEDLALPASERAGGSE